MIRQNPTTGGAAQRTLWILACLSMLLAGVFPAMAQSAAPHIVFQNQSSGQLVDWLMNGTQLSSYSFLQDPGTAAWKAVGSGDFTGDGNPDILLQNQGTGQLIYWQMNGTGFVQFGYISPSSPGSTNWKVAAVADLDGDGKPDILFQNQVTGQLVYWIMNGPSLVRYGYLNDPGTANWKVAGTGDFNGDGSADLLLQNQQSGALVVWLMNRTQFMQAVTLTSPGTINWQVVGVGDFTADGKPDILFQNQSNGQLIYWQMNGTSFTRFGYINPADPGSTAWKVTMLWAPPVPDSGGPHIQ